MDFKFLRVGRQPSVDVGPVLNIIEIQFVQYLKVYISFQNTPS